jgi:phosphoribosylformimino-5-aminoimidazole carboxamide ribotide isomerase
MFIIPAIDLQQGRCVRLRQGCFDEVSTYDVSPQTLAAQYATLGATRLHIVDLDGAKNGQIQQLPLIASLTQTPITIQAGGGVRRIQQAVDLLEAGVDKAVIGSTAVTSPALMVDMIETIGASNIVLAIDIKMNQQTPTPATHGWQQAAQTTLWSLVEYYQALGISEILCTDIQCDGMMQGPNFALYEAAVQRFPKLLWQASGGIRHLDDLDRLADIGLNGAILGRTLYEGDLDLALCCRRYASC